MSNTKNQTPFGKRGSSAQGGKMDSQPELKIRTVGQSKKQDKKHRL